MEKQINKLKISNVWKSIIFSILLIGLVSGLVIGLNQLVLVLK